MFKFLRDRRGYALPVNTMLIALVAMPTLILSSEIVRAMYVNVHIQTAVDAACAAAVQAVDVPHFVASGELLIDSSLASSYAQREFDATVARSNIESYTPVLTSLNITSNTIVHCQASASIIWSMPGLAPLSINVASAAEAEARR